MTAPAPIGQTDRRRGLAAVSVMLATIMQAVDTTIANVALPEGSGFNRCRIVRTAFESQYSQQISSLARQNLDLEFYNMK